MIYIARKLPETFEYIQYFKKNIDEVMAFGGENLQFNYENGTVWFGNEELLEGDYIVKDIIGRVEIYKEEHFKLLFENVGSKREVQIWDKINEMSPFSYKKRILRKGKK